jgi:integrase
MSKKKLWSKTMALGKYKVRIYEPRPGGNLMRSIYMDGKERRKSLGHKDRQRAVEDVQALLEHLQAERDAIVQEGSMTLGLLAHLYLNSAAHTSPSKKKDRTRKEDERKIERLVAFLEPATLVKALSEDKVLKYADARRREDPALLHTRAWYAAQRTARDTAEGDSPRRRRREKQRIAPEDGAGKGVGARAVEADIVALQTMLNWGAYKGKDEKGNYLLDANPLKRIAVESEKNPSRPVTTHDEYAGLLDVAGEVHPLLPLALVIAEATGRRLSAWRQLRWSDLDFNAPPHGRIVWPAGTDKAGRSQSTPMTMELREALLAALRKARSIGQSWVFPSPRDPEKPCSRHLLDDWLRRAYREAGIPRKPAGMWHPFRRKWATERKDHAVSDLAAAGGWADTEMVQVYIQVDQDSIDNVILTPTRRLRSGARRDDSQQTHNTAEKI